MVNLTTADISHSARAQSVLDGIRKHWPWVKPSQVKLDPHRLPPLW